MGKLVLSIKAGGNSKLFLPWFNPLKHPKLIASSMAGPLHNICPVFILLTLNIQIQLVKMTFDNINLPCPQYPPSLIVPIVDVPNTKCCSLFKRCLRDVDDFICLFRSDETCFAQTSTLTYKLEHPNISYMHLNFPNSNNTFLQNKIITFRFSFSYPKFLLIQKLYFPQLMFSSMTPFQYNLASISCQNIVCESIDNLI